MTKLPLFGADKRATETQVAQLVESREQLPHPDGFYLSQGGQQKTLAHYCPACKVDTKIFGTFENRSVRHCGRVDKFKNTFLRRLLLPKQAIVIRRPMVSCI
jgi:hypothetical protein